MFRFTIRDVLWLTVVAALVAGWWIDSRASRQAQAALRERINAQQARIEVVQLEAVTRKVREAELQIQLKRAEIENVRLQLIDDSTSARAGP